jgi:hypothetical protein
VALLSGASLSYEILIIRLVAIEQFHHFGAMAISVAMLGFGASGTALAVARPTAERSSSWLVGSAAASALLLAVSPLLARSIPLDAARIVWDPGQWWPVAGVYLSLAAPFVAVSFAILLAIRVRATRPGAIYGASFVGAAFGSGLTLAALWLLAADRAVFLPPLAAAAGALLLARRPVTLAPAVTATLLAGAGVLGTLGEVRVNPYKALPQVLAFPNAERVAEHHSPLGWLLAVKAPAFRYAPGLSLGYGGAFPAQTGLFVDGEIVGALTDLRGGAQDMVRWLPSALPYALAPRRVAVLGSEGGLAVQIALVHGADAVLAVELQPAIAELGRQLAAPGSVAPFTDPRVSVAVGDARAVMAGATQRYDLIALGSTGRLGASGGGLHALSEDFGHTVEAYVQYLERLAPAGTLAVSQWLSQPPRAAVRSILTVARALRETRPAALERGLVVAHGWATAMILARPDGFDRAAVAALRHWAASRGLDLDWYPGVEPDSLQPTNVLGNLDLTRAAAAATGTVAEAQAFANSYPFAVEPATDARPYPHHYLKTRAIPRFLRESRGSWLPFAEWGPIAAALAVLQGTVLGGLCLLVPVALKRGRRLRAARWLAVVSYFSLVGLAYMAAEIAALQQLQLLLGHPVYAAAAVLALLLLTSGFGAVASDRASERRGAAVAAALGLALIACAAGLLPLVEALQPARSFVRTSVGLACVAPIGFLMGMPFTLGLRRLAREDDGSLGWAWASNAFASVVAAPLAALVALELGSPAVFAIAAAAYFVAALLVGGARPNGT